MPVQEEMYFFAGAKGMGKHQPIEAKLRTFKNVQFFLQIRKGISAWNWHEKTF